MIRRAAVLVLALLSALLVDTVVLGAIEIAGASPSAVVLTVVAVALAGGPEQGLRYGFTAGLAVDLLSGGLVGANALVHVLVGYSAGLGHQRVDSSLPVQVITGTAATALAVGLHAGLLLLIDPGGLTASAVVVGAAGAGVFGGLLAPFVLRPVSAALDRVGTGLPT